MTPVPSQEAVERITAAAIQVGPCVYTGPHHATIIHYVAACTGVTPVVGEQGFMTSTGRYVDRAWARVLALQAGQVVEGKTVHARDLFSEDLWNVPDLDAALRAERERTLELADAALAYDAAIRRHATKGNPWVVAADLDALYADWITRALAVRALSDARDEGRRRVRGAP